MKITEMKKIILGIVFSLLGSLLISTNARADISGPYESRLSVTNLPLQTSFHLDQDQTVYYSISFYLYSGGYIRIKRGNTTILNFSGSSWEYSEKVLYGHFQGTAGDYRIEGYGGFASQGNSYGRASCTVSFMESGKLVRVVNNPEYTSSPSTGSFTPAMSTKIYYSWSGCYDGQGSWPQRSAGYLKIIDTSNNTIVLNPGPTATSGSFNAVAGRTYYVECYGGFHSVPYTSNIINYTGTVTLTYDNIPPTIVLTASKANQWVKSNSDGSGKVDFNITYSSNIQNSAAPLLVKMFLGPDGSTAPLYKSYSYDPANPTASIADNWPVPNDVNGPYQAYAELWENNGTNLKLGTSATIKFNIDNIPPTLNVTKSPDQSYYSSGKTPTINFNFEASDAGSGLNNVVVTIDGLVRESYTGTYAQNGTFKWEIPGLGQHTVTLMAADSAGTGNQSSQTFTINIDNTHPEFTGILQISPAPAYLSYVKANTVTYHWTGVNEEHFQEYRIKIESAFLNNPTGWTTVMDWTSTGNETSYQYIIPAEYNGQMLKATVKAVDLAGNEASISKIIISDQSVPTVTLPEYAIRFQTGALPGTGKAVCKWNSLNDNIGGVSDSGSGIGHYELALTETSTPPLQTVNTSANQYELSNISSSGSYYFWVRGVDRAGNTGAWTMSGPFPDFNISGPENNTIVNSAAFQATARKPWPDSRELRFKLKYKRAESSSYSSLPADYQTAVLTPVLSDGIWNWYLELKEYDQNGNPIPDSLQTTAVFAFQLAGETGAPVTLQPFFTTPGAVLQLTAMVAEPERITAYRWDMGDGNTVNGRSPQYSYGNQLDYDPGSQTAARVYPLALTVTYTDGSTISVQSTVTVQNTNNGLLHMNETWQGIHHLYGDVTVPEGTTLTILPGTQVIIEQSPGQTGYSNALIINGAINAGTGAVFQLADGTTLAGWKGITITGQAILDHVTIHHAQRAITTAGTDHVTITGSTISGNYTGVHVCGGHPAVSGTLFTGNTLYAIKEEDGWPKVTDCIFSGNGIDYYHDTLTKITLEQLNTLPERGNEGNHNQE
jgi:hypothetical protein